MEYVFSLYLCVIILPVSGACRYGSDPNCGFSCRCDGSETCDPGTGICSGSNPCGRDVPSPHRYEGAGCRIENLAYGKTATQGRTHGDREARRAVDGNAGTADSTCMAVYMPSKTDKAWWMVNLGNLQRIMGVYIYNNFNYKDRTNHFDIRVGTTNMIDDQTLCVSYSLDRFEDVVQVSCVRSLAGKYVSFRRNGGEEPDRANFCEFVVKGYEIVDCSYCNSGCSEQTGCNRCAAGKKLPDCRHSCPSGYWGVNCNVTCGHCKNSQACNRVSGFCSNGCADWYISQYCTGYIDIPDISTSFVRATMINDTTITIEWNKYDGSGFDEFYFYKVEYGTDTNYLTNFTSEIAQDVQSNGFATYTLDGLQYNTEYTIRVRVYRRLLNNTGEGVGSKNITIKTLCRAPEISPPDVDEQRGIIEFQKSRTLQSGCDYISKYELHYIVGDLNNTLDENDDTNTTKKVINITEQESARLGFDIEFIAWFVVENNENISSVSNRILIYIPLKPTTTSTTTKISNTNPDSTVDGVLEQDQYDIGESDDSGPSVGVIAGGVVGALFFIGVLITVAVILFLRNRKSTRNQPMNKSEMITSNGTHNAAEYNLETLPVVEKQQDKYNNTDCTNVETNHDNDTYCNIGTDSNPKTSVSVGELANYVTTMRKDPHAFKMLYESLSTDNGSPCTNASAPENMVKNRFKNIKPYDQTRVLLSDDDGFSDYINANFITGYGGKEKHYIAAQGPTSLTIDDFWRMISQQNICRIVMLTNEYEFGKHKCDRYWPQQKTDVEEHGSLSVTLVELEEYTDFVIRHLLVNNEENGKTHMVRQYHYISWLDKTIPEYAFPLMVFRRKLMANSDDKPEGPLLVHCSAGVGRTGTFIGLDYLLDECLSSGEVDVYNCVYKMREQRTSMVQTLNQYVFLHTSLVEYITNGETAIAYGQFDSRLSELRTVANGVSELEKQYLLLEGFPPLVFNDAPDGLNNENKDKNREKTIIPDDNRRPYLKTYSAGRNDYINAVFVSTYSRRNAFLVTQMPLGDTTIDFWRLVYEHNCAAIIMLNDIDDDNIEENLYMNNSTDTAHVQSPYIPQTKSKFGPLDVEVTSMTTEDEYVDRKIVVRNGTPESPDVVTHHIELLGWTDENDISIHTFGKVINLIDNTHLDNSGRPIIIQCCDGASQSGLIVAALHVLDRLTNDHEVDIFNSVKSVRVCRRQFIKSLKQYDLLFELAQRYKEQFETYYN